VPTGRASGTNLVRLGQSVDWLLSQTIKNRWVHFFLLHAICLSSTSREFSKWPWLATSEGHHLGLNDLLTIGCLIEAVEVMCSQQSMSFELAWTEFKCMPRSAPSNEYNVQTAMLQVMLDIVAGVLASIVMRTLACRQASVSFLSLAEPTGSMRLGGHV